MDTGCVLELCSLLFLTTTSGQLQINHLLVGLCEQLIFLFSQASVASAVCYVLPESCSSKECIEKLVPTFHITSQNDHRATGVVWFRSFNINSRHWIISRIYLCMGCSTCCGALKIHRKGWMRKNQEVWLCSRFRVSNHRNSFGKHGSLGPFQVIPNSVTCKSSGLWGGRERKRCASSYLGE